jgi:hypothetical protein
MTSLAFALVANALPFLPGGYTLTQQALQAVGEGLWVDIRTLEVGVEWEAPRG